MKRVLSIIYFLLLFVYLLMGYMNSKNLYFYSSNNLPHGYKEISIETFEKFKGKSNPILEQDIKFPVDGNLICTDDEYTCYLKLDNEDDFDKAFEYYKKNVASTEKLEFKEFKYKNYHRYMADSSNGYFYFIGIDGTIIFNFIATTDLDSIHLYNYYWVNSNRTFMSYYSDYIFSTILFVLLYLFVIVIIKHWDKIKKVLKNRLFLPILFIILGAIPYLFILIISIYSFFAGFEFFSARSTGIQAVFDTVYLVSYILWPAYIIGAILIGIGIYMLKKKKK